MLYRSLEGNTLSTNHGLNLKTSSPKTAGSSSGTEVMSFPDICPNLGGKRSCIAPAARYMEKAQFTLEIDLMSFYRVFYVKASLQQLHLRHYLISIAVCSTLLSLHISPFNSLKLSRKNVLCGATRLNFFAYFSSDI